MSRLKETVLGQTVKPVEWVIIEGGSKEDLEIVQELFNGYDWIHVIQQRRFPRSGYHHVNFAQAVNEAYECAKAICDKRAIAFSFVGKTDATVVLPSNYFETLLSEMKREPKLAVVSGVEVGRYKGRIIRKEPVDNLALTGFTDIRLYRKSFFEQVGGYPLNPSPDGSLLVKAVNRGWQVKVVKGLDCFEYRIGGSKIGIWRGSKRTGKLMYELGYNPLLYFLLTAYSAIRYPPHYRVVPALYGYCLSAVKREKRIDDDEIREYFGNTRLKEVMRLAMSKLWH
ncbi:MAG: glycosyltransferase family A protein [Halobacteriota archaeon]